jgi:tRNA(Arg) A34 adenosine deaminase TadA
VRQSADLKPSSLALDDSGLSRRGLFKLMGFTSLGLLQARPTAAASAPAESDVNTPRKTLCGWDHTSNLGPSAIDVANGFAPGELARHEKYIAEAVALSQQAEHHCNHPFGALLVLPPAAGEPADNYKVILKGENRVYTDNDATQHAETRLVSDANKSAYITKDMMARAILYTSAEPCAMCCGAIFWSGVRTVVYAAPHDSFGASSFPVPCREVFKFSAIDQAVTVIGPVSASTSIPIVGGYFKNRWRKVADACRIANKL